MLKAPKWCSNAVPTARGWAHPTTGELYVAKRFSQVEIDEFFGASAPAPEPVVVEQVVHEAPQMLHEAPVGNVSLSSMTKVQLQALCEEHGIEFTPKDTKAVLVEKLS